ncbi:hypothetical protein BC834DRAFT_388998 [Gloeopeniophorella convolvens]|nr:hypothetical protein BC834DRAFT_388998 [Gloeopeniophorella convolvens]
MSRLQAAIGISRAQWQMDGEQSSERHCATLRLPYYPTTGLCRRAPRYSAPHPLSSNIFSTRCDTYYSGCPCRVQLHAPRSFSGALCAQHNATLIPLTLPATHRHLSSRANLRAQRSTNRDFHPMNTSIEATTATSKTARSLHTQGYSTRS